MKRKKLSVRNSFVLWISLLITLGLFGMVGYYAAIWQPHNTTRQNAERTLIECRNLVNVERWDEAERACSQALAQAPDDLIVEAEQLVQQSQAGWLAYYYARGQSLLDAGEPQFALAEFEKVFARDPAYADVAQLRRIAMVLSTPTATATPTEIPGLRPGEIPPAPTSTPTPTFTPTDTATATPSLTATPTVDANVVLTARAEAVAAAVKATLTVQAEFTRQAELTVAALTARAPAPTPTFTPSATYTPTRTPTPTRTSTALARAAPAPGSNEWLRNKLLDEMRRSAVHNHYSQQGVSLVDALIARLPEFQLPSLGITEASMREALSRPGAGDRLNAVVHEVMSDPGQSPFRQLIWRLIHGRQGTLVDNQQHALHSLFTRAENSRIWIDNVDGVIGAINRESFLWP